MRFILYAVAVIAALPCAAADAESWNLHGQSTYVWQYKPAFASSYSGANSLGADRERSYSFTSTAALGLRLAEGTELYVDPEVAQGVAFSDLTGLAGFSNGELAKTSGPKPRLYLARAFLRHVIGLGGGSSQVAPAANQLGTSYDNRRIVFTAGTISLLDVFDVNATAHDPRTQFMNWAFMTHAAYDYAADARGYTYGAAVEYFGDRWSARAGRFAQPLEPNQLKLDSKLLRHYGDQIELSRDYEALGGSGTVRALAFHSKAVMASYGDALRGADGHVPTLDAVRDHEHDKWGVGAGFEHKLRPDMSIFARALRADGRTETYAFTEADQSASIGMRMSGTRWSRERDTAGVAVAVSGLSLPHRRYLEQGGQTFFLGDGRLNYAHERAMEAYYSFSLGHGLNVSLDAQRIENPGYNADRGPAAFYGFRLHWEG